MEKNFSIRGVLKEANDILKPKRKAAVGQYLLIYFALSALFSFLFGKGAFLGSVITGYIGVKWALAYMHKGSFSFDDIFENITFKKFIYFTFTILLVGLSVVWPILLGVLICGVYLIVVRFATFGGNPVNFFTVIIMGLSLIPAVRTGLRLMFAKFIVLENEVKPIEALRESRKITKGIEAKLFGFCLVVLLINVLGLLCLIVGVFFTAPLTVIATALLYKKFTKQEESNEPIEVVEVIVETVEMV